MSVNDRATSFRDFCVFMLGSQESTPLKVGEDQVNGAFLSALIDAFKACYPTEPVPRGPVVPERAAPTRDPLGATQ